MDDYSSRRVLIFDDGNYTDLASRLARDWGQVDYYKPWEKSAPLTSELLIGDGFPGVNRVEKFFDAVKGADLIVFPDCYHGDLQTFLVDQGYRVFGSRNADRLEYMRDGFKSMLKQSGLPVVPYKKIIGMERLREYLQENPNQVVKMSKCRGDGETFTVKNYKTMKSHLDAMEFHYGPVANKVPFIVEQIIETEQEPGYDGWCIDGQCTDGFVDFETKNESCLIACLKYEDMDAGVREVNERIAPFLAKEQYRGPMGTEIRRAKDGTDYFLDLTSRTAQPPGECQWEITSNLSDIMYHGAEGQLVQPDFEAKFGCELMLHLDWKDRAWVEVVIPEKHRRWVKLSSAFKSEGVYYPVAYYGVESVPWSTEGVGAVVGIGDTLEEAIEAAKEHAEAIDGFGLHYDMSAVAEGLASIKAATDDGMSFGDTKIPDPASILDEA